MPPRGATEKGRGGAKATRAAGTLPENRIALCDDPKREARKLSVFKGSGGSPALPEIVVMVQQHSFRMAAGDKNCWV